MNQLKTSLNYTFLNSNKQKIKKLKNILLNDGSVFYYSL